MNVIFLSPHFPTHFYQFCNRLKVRGVNVLGIGDASYINETVQNSLTEYQYISSLEDYDQVMRKVAYYIYHYGRIDYIESQNEYWLELEAKLRDDFHITTGPGYNTLKYMNHKSLMKEAYQRANILTARYKLIENIDDALEFASDVGYPVIVKPDHGVGANHTYKLHNDDEILHFWQHKPDLLFIEEEVVKGHVETFDGITDSHKNVLFASSQVLPVSLMDAVNLDNDVVSIGQAPTKDLYDAGCRLLNELDSRNKFFHFEFFRLDDDKDGLGLKGDIVGLEVNMRAPGGYITDKMNYSFDSDVYTIWADSLIYDKCFMQSEFKHYVTHFGRKNSINYAYSNQDIRNKFASKIIQESDVDQALAAEMGNHAFLVRADNKDELDKQINYILKRRDNNE
ncbi:MAG: carbamoylphosphate synthase large subunit [Erysipelotrichaceae bacterium]|nr:carbamoylphosphate synthase large subunit [Erysipelotrichaceae bacterium]